MSGMKVSNPEQLHIKLPKCPTKTILRKDIMKQWQSEWDEGTHLFCFSQNMAFPFISTQIPSSQFSFYGEIGIPIHNATSCLLTMSLHMKKPDPSLEQEWFTKSQ
ncbi:hypothetical protein AVEN_71217-1 [Araneus ventricosus]|uniref:Uncharacterized protein n=1 Tax=Araneus ventricosus TaxID=182803 RepID=A0A4Y2IPA9_ARAVE|nr:hypothetical protein AVEN_71217-1 [Araneus ventricosus]